MFCYGSTALCSVRELRIAGEHNKVNALAAIDAIWQYTQDPEAIKAGLNAFHGLPHRLAFVAEMNGVRYYDDSIATTPGSAIAALQAFPDTQKTIILGGSYKGSDFTELAHELTQHRVRALLIGDEAQTGCNAVLSPVTKLLATTAVLPCVHFNGTLKKGFARGHQ
jgi:UDP-N-acetylmuramoylalanine--D-glutamate ligase